MKKMETYIYIALFRNGEKKKIEIDEKNIEKAYQKLLFTYGNKNLKRLYFYKELNNLIDINELKEKIKNNICKDGILLKTIRKWNITIKGNELMIYNDLQVTYMNDYKAWDDPFIIPKDVVKWAETVGIKYLNAYLKMKEEN